MIELKTLVRYVIMPVLALAIALAVGRLLRGPSLPDRVVALDLLVSLGIGVAVVHAIYEDQPAFLDVAVILALVAFLGTVAFAAYVEASSRP